MNRIRLNMMVALTAAAITMGIGSGVMATDYAQQFKQPRMGRLKTPTTAPKPASKASGQPTETLEAIHAKRLPALKASVEQAVRHLQAGHQQAALEELAKAQDAIVSLEGALGRHVKPQFGNTRCPIMGSPIRAENVAQELTRTYMGQKIAFCCGGCPAAWDRLAETQKQAKLRMASGAGMSGTSHDHHQMEAQ